MAATMRRASVARRLRSLGGTLIRRAGLLPGGTPDGLGEDARLADAVWEQQVLVFFSETLDGLYQLQGWYEPLRALDAERGVVVVCMDSRVARTVAAESGLTVHTVAQESTLEGLLERSSALKLCLYVNNHPLNFIPLRFRSLSHVNLLHGDSDKIATVSNQLKAYDSIFVAGRAAIDRYSAYLPFFDAEARCVVIGRPQVDAAELRRAQTGRVGRTILYAPTWEGAGPTVAYGSVRSHGVALVRSLITDGFTVVYRPHPLSGVREPSYGEADVAVRAVIDAAATADPQAGHRISTSGPIASDFAGADLLVGDVSAVTVDWLPTGRPLIVTVPAAETTQVARTRLLEVAPRLQAADAGTAGHLAAHHLAADPTAGARGDLVEYYFGDVEPGAALRHFLDACSEAIARRDAEWRRLEALRGENDS